MRTPILGKVTAVAILAVTAFSQTPSKSTKPASSADSFRLSMPKVEATVNAYVNLFEVLAADPLLRQRWKAQKAALQDSGEDTNGRDTTSMVAAKMASDPRIASAFAKAGITPKEAGMTMETLVGSMLGSAMLESSGKRAGELPAGFVKENVEFARANKAAIQAAFERMASLAKRHPSLAELEDKKAEEEEDSDPKD
jgi:hypothetical protein